jgi:hypothetical protein
VSRNCAGLRDNIVQHPVRRKSCFYDDLTGKAVMMVWSGRVVVSSMYPGFDNRHAGWDGRWRYIRRFVDDGEVMALTWDKNIEASERLDIPWIQIVTWNAWPEGTSVEPATLPPDGIESEPHFGYQALETCREKIIAFKGISDLPDDHELSIRIPYEIYKLRRQNKHDQADKILHHFMNNRHAEAMQIAKDLSQQR